MKKQDEYAFERVSARGEGFGDTIPDLEKYLLCLECDGVESTCLVLVCDEEDAA